MTFRKLDVSGLSWLEYILPCPFFIRLVRSTLKVSVPSHSQETTSFNELGLQVWYRRRSQHSVAICENRVGIRHQAMYGIFHGEP